MIHSSPVNVHFNLDSVDSNVDDVIDEVGIVIDDVGIVIDEIGIVIDDVGIVIDDVGIVIDDVGIVIDDAIVVLENIYRFVEEKGMDPFRAAVEGTREIGLAVLATTMALLAVFIPVGFMTGIVGRFMSSFGLTSAAAIAVSLIVSFTLTPMLAARWVLARLAMVRPTPIEPATVAARANQKYGRKSTIGS